MQPQVIQKPNSDFLPHPFPKQKKLLRATFGRAFA
jgi:hypothetical protein